MNLSTKGIETNTRKEYIRPGIMDSVTFISATLPEADEPNGWENGQPRRFYINLKVTGQEDDAANAFRQNLTSPAAVEISMRKLKEIATAMVTEAAIDGIVGDNTADYLQKVTNLLQGKTFRCKFKGEEKLREGVDSDGNETMKLNTYVDLPVRYFAEPNMDGAQFTKVESLENTRLRWDPENEYDLKRTELPDNVTVTKDEKGFRSIVSNDETTTNTTSEIPHADEPVAWTDED